MTGFEERDFYKKRLLKSLKDPKDIENWLKNHYTLIKKGGKT